MIDFNNSPGKLTKHSLNTQIVCMRPVVKKSTIHIITKLVRTVKHLHQRSEKHKPNENQCLNKVEKLLNDINILKKLDKDDISKFVLQNIAASGNSSGLVLNDVPVPERLTQRLLNHKAIKDIVTKFRSEHPNWKVEVPYLLSQFGVKLKKKLPGRAPSISKLPDNLKAADVPKVVAKRDFKSQNEQPCIGMDDSGESDIDAEDHTTAASQREVVASSEDSDGDDADIGHRLPNKTKGTETLSATPRNVASNKTLPMREKSSKCKKRKSAKGKEGNVLSASVPSVPLPVNKQHAPKSEISDRREGALEIRRLNLSELSGDAVIPIDPVICEEPAIEDINNSNNRKASQSEEAEAEQEDDFFLRGSALEKEDGGVSLKKVPEFGVVLDPPSNYSKSSFRNSQFISRGLPLKNLTHLQKFDHTRSKKLDSDGMGDNFRNRPKIFPAHERKALPAVSSASDSNRSERGHHESLHPSWAAKKMLKEKQKYIVPFQGKKIIFDN